MAEEKIETFVQKADQEGEKLYFEAMKHLTTLSTGSILLLVTFLEKLFSNPRWRILIALSLGSFVLSILCSLSSMLQSASHVKNSGKFPRFEVTIKDVMYYSSLAAFLLGIISLVVFALRNIY